MGQEQNKYHVSKDGKVYRVNEDGSFTELGNAEDLYNPIHQSKNIKRTKRNSSKYWVICLILIVIVIGGISISHSSSSSYDGFNNTEVAVDSTSHEIISNEVIDENPDFDEWREHASNYINNLITSPSKSHYDSPEYSATNSSINAAIDMFYDENPTHRNNKYGYVEEHLFYPAYRQNNATAQFFLGCIYENGEHGINHDSKTAFYWFEQAANNGHGTAAYYLYRDYYKNKEDKIYWLHKAAELNDDEAIYFLAESYEYGKLTNIDLNKALELYLSFEEQYEDDLHWNVAKDIKRVKTKLGI